MKLKSIRCGICLEHHVINPPSCGGNHCPYCGARHLSRSEHLNYKGVTMARGIALPWSAIVMQDWSYSPESIVNPDATVTIVAA